MPKQKSMTLDGDVVNEYFESDSIESCLVDLICWLRGGKK